ncbi:MAG: MBL fold metallo-hydrolase [Oligoflexales bacterium]
MRILIAFTIILSSCSTKNFDKEIKDIRAPFDGQRFNNIEPFKDKSFWDVMSWRIFTERSEWEVVKNQKFSKPSVKRSKELILTLIGHSSVLIQIDDVNIITDPHYSERASPVSFAGPKRVIKPAIKFEDLPPIDFVLISHNHYDHLDIETLKSLDQVHAPEFLVGLGNKALLENEGIKKIVEMDWWDFHKNNSLKIHFTPVQHWSARGIFDRRTTLWGGFIIEGSKKIFFAGDTGYGKVFKQLYDDYGPMDVGLIPIGAYEPRGFMKNAHINPEEAVKIFLDLKIKYGFGIHSRTFADLTDEPRDQPLKDLRTAMQKYKIEEGKFIAPDFGKEYKIHNTANSLHLFNPPSSRTVGE